MSAETLRFVFVSRAGWHARTYTRDGLGPVLHLATFALDARDGDFGGGATARMRADDAFAALIAYPAAAGVSTGQGLFEESGWRSRLRAHEFSASQLQVTRIGQIGVQRFFTHLERPCCLYAVVQPVRKRPEKLIAELSAALSGVRFR